MLYATLYYVIGLIVTIISINHYRPNGTTDKVEMILSAIGPIIWPLQVIKWFLDKKHNTTTKKP